MTTATNDLTAREAAEALGLNGLSGPTSFLEGARPLRALREPEPNQPPPPRAHIGAALAYWGEVLKAGGK